MSRQYKLSTFVTFVLAVLLGYLLLAKPMGLFRQISNSGKERAYDIVRRGSD